MSKVMIYWDKDIRAYHMKMSKYEHGKTDKIVEFLKANIPFTSRSYDNATRIWTFDEPFLDGTVKLCELVYGKPEVSVLLRSQVESFASQASSAPVKTTLTGIDATLLEFVKLLPYEAAQRAYKIASLSLHPDRPSGSMEKMTRLNSTWQQIEKEVYKQ